MFLNNFMNEGGILLAWHNLIYAFNRKETNYFTQKTLG